ncbi:MAG: hypothetical protein QXL51_00610 [Candidatus Aenigmatarchaeota archaeon]
MKRKELELLDELVEIINEPKLLYKYALLKKNRLTKNKEEVVLNHSLYSFYYIKDILKGDPLLLSK